MAALTVQDISGSGLEPAYTAAAGGGDTIADDGTERTFLHVENGGASEITVTVTAQSSSLHVEGYGTLARANLSVAVPAGEGRMIGPFPPNAFKDSSGNVAVSYSDVTSVTVAALRLPKA